MKFRVFLCVWLVVFSALAETNQVFLEKLEVSGKFYTNCTVRLSNPVQAVIFFDGGGGAMVSVTNLAANVLTQINYSPVAAQKYLDIQEQRRQAKAQAEAKRLAEIEAIKKEREWNMRSSLIKGDVDSIQVDVLIVNATKDRFVRTGSTLTANQSIGAFNAGGGSTGYTVEEFDRQIALTNFPSFSKATVGEKVQIRATRAGNFNNASGQRIELWDCSH
jgi:hypothetical protein